MRLKKHQRVRIVRAAEKIVDYKEDYACEAISPIWTGQRNLRNKFTKIMSPDDLEDYGFITFGWFGKPSEEQNRLARSLALLFFAEVTK